MLIPGGAGGADVWDKCVFITGCDGGSRELLARQMDLRVLRVLSVCVCQSRGWRNSGTRGLKAGDGDPELHQDRKHHCGHPVDFKEHAGDRGTIQISFVYFFFLSEEETLDSNLESFKVFSRS